jgi:hypothetical protein
VETLLSFVFCFVALTSLVFIGAMLFFLVYWTVRIPKGDELKPCDVLGIAVWIIILLGFLIVAGDRIIAIYLGE